MQPLFEHRLKVDGYETRALELEGDGPSLVLFHGYGDSADTWRPLLDHLARAGRRALAVDLPGFGRASRLGPGALLPQWDAFAGALVEQIAGEHGDPVIASGNSLGGCISLRLAERADLPLEGVIPIAPAGLDMPTWINVVTREPVLRRLLALPIPIPRVVLEAAVGEVYRRLAFSRPRDADRRVIAAFCSHHADRTAVAGVLDVAHRLLPELLELRAFEFERVQAPVLLIWGTRDRMVSHSGARILQDALPDTVVELLDGIGHCPQLEATDRVAELVLGFSGQGALQAA